MTERRLPDGTITTDQARYVEEWFNLADEVASLFPGYHVNGVDPNISLWKGLSTLSLTLEQAKLLLAEVKRRELCQQINKYSVLASEPPKKLT